MAQRGHYDTAIRTSTRPSSPICAQHIKRRCAISTVSSLVAAAALALTLFVIMWLVADHQLSLAAGAAIVALRRLAAQITGVFSNIQDIFESGLFLEDLEHFLGGFAPRPALPTPADPAPSNFARLDVEHVSFTYPGGHAPALTEVDLHLRRGEVVALVGENGSGKTTLAKLLAALYQPDSGTITWDGRNIAEFDPGQLRLAIGVIFHDFVRYELSAGANVALGRPEADETDPAIIDAARHSGAAAMFEVLPGGFETVLSKEFASSTSAAGCGTGAPTSSSGASSSTTCTASTRWTSAAPCTLPAALHPSDRTAPRRPARRRRLQTGLRARDYRLASGPATRVLIQAQPTLDSGGEVVGLRDVGRQN